MFLASRKSFGNRLDLIIAQYILARKADFAKKKTKLTNAINMYFASNAFFVAMQSI